MMRDNKDGLLVNLSVFIPFLCFSFYLIAFYPAMMTPDSIDQWEQIVTLKFNNWHPVMHTLFNYLCTRVWYSPACVAIAQILILSLVFFSGVKMLYRMGVSIVSIVITTSMFSLYPTNGFMAVTLWKDVSYSTMLLWMTIILIKIVNTKGSWIESKGNWIVFILNSLAVIFFRHNGIVTFFFVTTGLAIAFKKHLKYWGILTICVIAVYLAVIGPVYKWMNVVHTSSTEAMGIPMQQIASVIKYKGNISDEQAAFFNKILPLKVWSEEYNPYITNPLKFHKDFNSKFLKDNKVEFFRNWIAVIKQNPDIAMTAFVKQTSMIWRVVPLKDSFTYTVTPGIFENNLGLKTIIINKSVTGYGIKIFNYTNKEDKLVIFWRPALWLYLSLAAGVLIAVLSDIKYLLTLFPILSNVLGFMIAIPSQDYRYQYANVLIAFVLLPWAMHMIYERIVVRKLNY